MQVPSGLDYKIDYDSNNGLMGITTPSGEQHRFSRHLNLNFTALSRSVPFSVGGPFVATVDEQGRLLSFISPHYRRVVNYQRDVYGRLIALKADGGVVSMKYLNNSDILAGVDGSSFSTDFELSGPLVSSTAEHRKNSKTGEILVSARFDYEYDDVLRLTAVC